MTRDTPRIVCARCGAQSASEERIWRCGCGGPLDLVLPDARILPKLTRERPMTLWRYGEALPPLRERVSLGEGATPLVPITHQGRTVWLKCDYLLPTGSYKDRGAAILMSHLKTIGIRQAAEDSSGNAAASLAAYAARAGIALTVFCPTSASPGKLAQVRLYGATLRPIEGPRQRATEALEAHLAATGDFYASHLWHPFFVEGIKTLAFEVAEQRGWRAPDAVLCPVGAGSILLGLHKGFAELARAGVIDRTPRLFAVQAAQVAPVARAYERDETDVTPVTAPLPTLAEGIALPRPVRGPEVLRALRETNGGVATVSEAEIRDGLLALGRQGFCVEPTSAVVLKGLDHLHDRGVLRSDEEVVLVLSGFGLKASARLEELIRAG